MNFKKYLSHWVQFKFDRNSRLMLLAVYAVIMLATISTQIDMVVFILLFLILPVTIYFFVKSIFPPGRK